MLKQELEGGILWAARRKNYCPTQSFRPELETASDERTVFSLDVRAVLWPG